MDRRLQHGARTERLLDIGCLAKRQLAIRTDELNQGGHHDYATKNRVRTDYARRVCRSLHGMAAVRSGEPD